MSTTHTQGPWEADADEMAQGADDIFTVSVWAAGQDGDRMHIAVVSAFSLLSGTHGDTELVTTDAPSADKLTEAKANARLIAAAPDLLAALEAVWREGVIPDGFALLQDQVSDAIARATGAES